MRVCHKEHILFSLLHDILHHDFSASYFSSLDVFSLDVSSSDFTDESEGNLAYRITHGFSQNFGRWPMARARYMLLLFFVTQISQMTQIFFVGGFCPTDFTDYHRYYMESLVNLFFHSQGVSATTGQVASAKIRE